MSEIAKLILDEGGWLAVAIVSLIAILAMMTFILWKLVSAADSDGEIVKKQAVVIGDLVAPMRDISEALAVVSDANKSTGENLVRVAVLLNEHDKRVASIQDILASAVGKMSESASERERQIEDLPERVRIEMAPDFERIPAAVNAALAPEISALREELKALFADLDQKLSEQIITATGKIPEETTALIRADLQALAEKVDAVVSIARDVTAAPEPPEPTATDSTAPDAGERA